MPDPSLISDPGWAKVATDWALAGLAAAATGLAGAYAYVRRRDDAHGTALRSLASRVDAHDIHLAGHDTRLSTIPRGDACAAHGERLTRVETALAHAPGKTDISNVHRRLDDLSRGLAEATGELHSMGALLARIDNYLRARP